ncbi:MAG: acylphosphatase [Candidatus Krumholzibacteriota bacterium]|nr:acylphosphatase [Candidatus Krumholzibacteriota bacterium]
MFAGLKKVRITIKGRVQGVGFRFFTRSLAGSLGICGFVRNRPDGSVEAEASGPEDKIEKFLERLSRGPASASVSSVEIEEIENDGSDHRFEVRF